MVTNDKVSDGVIRSQHQLLLQPVQVFFDRRTCGVGYMHDLVIAHTNFDIAHTVLIH